MAGINVQFTWHHIHKEKSFEKEHMHDAIEIVYYVRGEGKTIIGGKEYPYKAGTVCYIPQGVLHSEYHKTETEVMFFAFNMSEQLFEDMDINVFADKNGTILKKFILIEDENSKKQPYYRTMINSFIAEILVTIARNSGRGRDSKKELPKLIEDTCAYIQLNAHLNVNAKEVAKKQGYSYDYFRHIFKKYRGEGLKEFITSARKAKVIEYLVNTDKSIKEIAKLCNFGGVQDLSKWFKQAAGISPSQYRKKYKPTENKLQVKYTE